MNRKELARLLAVSATAILTLSGCSTWRGIVNYVQSDSESICPDVAILANTSVIPVFDPNKGADPANVVYTMKMTGISTRCDYSKRGHSADVNLRAKITATRAPGGDGAHYKVPYYLAVTTDGKVIDKQVRWFEFDFPKSAASVTAEIEVDSLPIKMAPQKRSFEYHVLTGFQLTQTQIDYNKKMGQYLP